MSTDPPNQRQQLQIRKQFEYDIENSHDHWLSDLKKVYNVTPVEELHGDIAYYGQCPMGLMVLTERQYYPLSSDLRECLDRMADLQRSFLKAYCVVEYETTTALQFLIQSISRSSDVMPQILVSTGMHETRSIIFGLLEAYTDASINKRNAEFDSALKFLESTDVRLKLLRTLGLSETETLMLMNQFKSIKEIATASCDYLLEHSPLSTGSAEFVTAYFNNAIKLDQPPHVAEQLDSAQTPSSRERDAELADPGGVEQFHGSVTATPSLVDGWPHCGQAELQSVYLTPSSTSRESYDNRTRFRPTGQIGQDPLYPGPTSTTFQLNSSIQNQHHEYSRKLSHSSQSQCRMEGLTREPMADIRPPPPNLENFGGRSNTAVSFKVPNRFDYGNEGKSASTSSMTTYMSLNSGREPVRIRSTIEQLRLHVEGKDNRKLGQSSNFSTSQKALSSASVAWQAEQFKSSQYRPPPANLDFQRVLKRIRL